MTVHTNVSLLSSVCKTPEMFARLKQINDDSFVGVQRAPLGVFQNVFEVGDVYVSEILGIIVGFAIVTMKNGSPYLWGLAVDPKYRRQSIGRQLLEFVIGTERIRRKDFIDLACKVDNPAQKLYFDVGFRVRAVARGFYGDEGDGLLMRREL